MSVFKCKMCGGTIEFEPGSTVGVCDSCGTRQTLPKTEDEQISNLFNRANNLRLKCEFDKAEAIYERIVEKDDSEAEAHWGIVLCKYGIEYVEDPKTLKRIPTCHRTRFDAVTADPDYQAAVDYADVGSQSIYEAEARAIDRIQKDILAIVKNETPFDVFICYKETDENGKRTVDSTIANDIYYQLTDEGFKVFYAAITLEDKLGQEYEPYIFAALNSARVMLAVGTKPEYFNAVWVKNEWSRFMNLMKTDRQKLLIPCYRDMDAYELPEEFAHLQAQDMGKIGFVNDVVRGIRKVIGRQTEPAPRPEAAPSAAAPEPHYEIAPLLKRAFLSLEDEDFDKADELCEQALNMDPENAEGYLVKLLCEYRLTDRDKLMQLNEPIDGSRNYQRIMRFGNADMKQYMAEVNDAIIRNYEVGVRKMEYRTVLKSMNQAKTSDEVRKCMEKLEAFRGYGDADEMIEKCRATVSLLEKIEQRNRLADAKIRDGKELKKATDANTRNQILQASFKSRRAMSVVILFVSVICDILLAFAINSGNESTVAWVAVWLPCSIILSVLVFKVREASRPNGFFTWVLSIITYNIYSFVIAIGYLARNNAEKYASEQRRLSMSIATHGQAIKDAQTRIVQIDTEISQTNAIPNLIERMYFNCPYCRLSLFKLYPDYISHDAFVCPQCKKTVQKSAAPFIPAIGVQIRDPDDTTPDNL